MASTTFSGPVTSTAGFVSGSDSLVSITADATITSASHAGRTMLLNKAAGATLTLPAASGTGNTYKFFVQTTVTSNSYKIQVASASDTMAGIAVVANDSDNTASIFETAADSDTITLDGTTTGGILGGGSTTLTGALSATTATASVVVVGSAVTSNSQGIDVTGVVTATTVKVGSAISFTDGAVSATRFHGDGSNLTGIDASSIKNGNDVKIQANASGATVTGVITAVGGNPNEGAFLKGTAVGVGTTTLAGRNAGVGTAPGTIIFNATSGILQVYVNDLDTWQNVSSAEGYSFQATGGTKSTTSRSGYAVHTFTAPGTFTVLSNTVTGGEYLIVAGGGGGGKGSLPGIGNEAGAGGAGGHRSFSGQTFTPGSYTVVVGSGGPGSGTGGDGGTSVSYTHLKLPTTPYV